MRPTLAQLTNQFKSIALRHAALGQPVSPLVVWWWQLEGVNTAAILAHLGTK